MIYIYIFFSIGTYEGDLLLSFYHATFCKVKPKVKHIATTLSGYDTDLHAGDTWQREGNSVSFDGFSFFDGFPLVAGDGVVRFNHNVMFIFLTIRANTKWLLRRSEGSRKKNWTAYNTKRKGKNENKE